jgi:pimeloyl-ACP methyl ester carboxylesterase
MKSLLEDTFVGTKCEGTYYYLTTSEGREEQPVVVLIHGLGCASYYYYYLSFSLENAGFRVLMYDLIGRGRSDHPSNAVFDGPAHVNQLRTLLSNLRAQGPLQIPAQYHVIGHSQGGAVAALYVSQYAEEVRSVVFLAPAGLMDLGMFPIARCFMPLLKLFPHRKMDPKPFFRDDFPESGELDGRSKQILEELIHRFNENSTANPMAYTAILDCVAQFPFYGLDSEVQRIGGSKHLSTMVIWGKKDTMVPFDPNFDRWRNALGVDSGGGGVSCEAVDSSGGGKVVRYKVYDDLKHKFYLVKPDVVNPDILKFLTDAEAFLVTDTAGAASGTAGTKRTDV